MRLVLDMDKEVFIEAIKNNNIKEMVEFFLDREYPSKISIEEFLDKSDSVIEICDTIEFDVEELGNLLIDEGIPYSKFVLIEEYNEVDDMNSIRDAEEAFPDLDIYSEYQRSWV